MIGAIHGPAMVHAELGLLSDIVLASDTAQFQDAPHFTDGVVPGDSVQLVWQMLLGSNRGRYFLLTRQKLYAQEALALGVVSEVLPKDKLLGRAWEWTRYITARPTLARRYARVVLTQMLKQQMLEHVSHGVALEGLAGSVSWGMGGKSTND